MNVAELKKRILRSFAYPELFYLPTIKTGETKTSKLIIQFELYTVLNDSLDGFYEVPTHKSYYSINPTIDFVIIDIAGNIVYRYDRQHTTDKLPEKVEIELDNGEYYFKILYMRGCRIVGDEHRNITVQGETNTILKFYVRHFKAVTVNSDNIEIFTTSSPFSSSARIVDNPIEFMRLSQVDIYELKWDTWVKVLSYNCTPMQLDYYQVDSANTTTCNYVVGFVKNKVSTYTYTFEPPMGGERTTKIVHFATYRVSNTNRPSNVTKEMTFLDDTRYSANSYGLQSAYPKLMPCKEENGVDTSSSCGPYLNRELYTTAYDGQILVRFSTLIGAQAAINVYQEIQKGADVYDIDDISAEKFFNSFGGSSLWKFKRYNSWDKVWIEEYRIIFTKSLYDTAVEDTNAELIKTYLPTISYFDSDFKRERERDEAYSGAFWNWNNGVGYSPVSNGVPVTVNENGVDTSYSGLMIFNNLTITNINAMNSNSFIWYAEDYDKYI